MRKIDFTCKKIVLKDLIQCNYNLNESEYAIFSKLINSKKGYSVKELVEKIGKDRTTVQKIVSKLLKRDLLTKKQINLERGFMFLYLAKNKENVISEIENNVNNYFNSVRESLEKWKSKI